MRPSQLFVIGFFFFPLYLFAQGQLVLLPGSEKIYYNKRTQTHRLVGTVNFTYQGNTMYCDSAHYREYQKVVWAYGRVHIAKDDIHIYCDSLKYTGATRTAQLWGNVRIRDNTYKFASDSVEYNANTGKAIYRRNGRIENSVNNEIITSRIGYFYPSTGSYFFSGNVVYQKNSLRMTTDTLQFAYEKQTTYFHGPTTIKNDSIEAYCGGGYYLVNKNEGQLRKNVRIYQPERTILCDTAYYKERNQEFTAKGHVWIDEKNEHLQLTGDYFNTRNDKPQSLLKGNAMVIESRQKDSLFIQAQSIRMLDHEDNHRTLFASPKVRIFSNQLQAIADSAMYQSKEGLVHLYKSPILWSNNAELKGDTVRMVLKDSLVEQVSVTGNATTIIAVDTGKYYNQLSGKRIISYVNNNEITKAEVKGNAWTVYYPIEDVEEDTVVIRKRIGMNRLYASDLVVFLKEGEVDRITYLDKPDGIFYPMDKIDEKEKFIKNFSWNPGKRPRRPNVSRKYR